MAVISGQTLHQEDEDNEQQQQGTTPPPSPGAAPSAQYTAPSAGQKPGTPTSSGRFVNLQKYMQANTGEGGRMATQVANPYEQKATQAKASIYKGAQDFKTLAEKARAPQFEQSKVTQALSNPYALYESQQQGQPNEQLQTLTGYLGAEYKGPMQLEEVADTKAIQQQQQQVAQAGEFAKTGSGRSQLLRTQYAQPGQRYTGGFTKLDQLLLQQSKPGIQQLQNLEQHGQEVEGQLGFEKTLAGQKASELVGEAGETRRQTGEAVSSTEASIQDIINNQVAEEQAKEAARAQQAQTLSGALATDEGLSDEQLSQLGLTRDMETFGVDPSQFFKYLQGMSLENPEQAKQILATAQQSGGIVALQRLLGKNPTFDVSRAGTYRGGEQQFNMQNFIKSVSDARGAYESAVKDQAEAGAQSLYDQKGIPRIKQRIQDMNQGIDAFANKTNDQEYLQNKSKIEIYNWNINPNNPNSVMQRETRGIKEKYIGNIHDINNQIQEQTDNIRRYEQAMSDLTADKNKMEASITGLDPIRDKVERQNRMNQLASINAKLNETASFYHQIQPRIDYLTQQRGMWEQTIADEQNALIPAIKERLYNEYDVTNAQAVVDKKLKDFEYDKWATGKELENALGDVKNNFLSKMQQLATQYKAGTKLGAKDREFKTEDFLKNFQTLAAKRGY